jgi:hypothetical protein
MLSACVQRFDLARHLLSPLGMITVPRLSQPEGSGDHHAPLELSLRRGATYAGRLTSLDHRRVAFGSRAAASTAISLSEGGRNLPALIAGGPCAASTASFSAGSARR